MISLDFLIEDEKKNIINIKENHYKFQYFSLNNFLFYYNNRLLFLKNSSTNNEFAPKKVIGWQMQLRENFFLNYESLHLIKENINGYREQKTLKKQFYE